MSEANPITKIETKAPIEGEAPLATGTDKAPIPQPKPEKKEL